MGDFRGLVYTVLSNNTLYGSKEEVVQILGLDATVPASAFELAESYVIFSSSLVLFGVHSL